MIFQVETFSGYPFPVTHFFLPPFFHKYIYLIISYQIKLSLYILLYIILIYCNYIVNYIIIIKFIYIFYV